MWMDHRAEDQANTINATEHEVLDYVGGKMSLEMEPPKLLWLKQVFIRYFTKIVKNLFYFKFHDHIWNHIEKCIEISINMPSIG